MKQQIQLAISLSPDTALRPIMPNQYDRFSSRKTDEGLETRNHSFGQIHIQIRACEPESDCLLQSLSLRRLIHPEGGLVYCCKCLVSDCPISNSLRDIGDQIVDRCSTMGRRDVTVFLRHEGPIIEYYAADHADESIFWINGQRPDCLRGLPESRVGNTLCEEYWAHVEAFPGAWPIGVKSIRRLRNALSSLAIDSATSDGSTSPFSREQIQNFLRLLGSFSENHIDEYQTYAVARIWNMIWHARVINNFASQDACLDRFITLSDSPVKFTGVNALLVLCTFGVANKHLARCSRAWSGRIAYTGAQKY